MADHTHTPPRAGRETLRGALTGLSARLLLITAVFVLLVQTLVLVPSLTNYRTTWLRDRLQAAQAAVLVLEDRATAAQKRERLEEAGVLSVVLRLDDTRQPFASILPPRSQVGARYDMRGRSFPALAGDTLATLISGDRLLQIIGVPRYSGGQSIEIVIRESLLRSALWAHGREVLGNFAWWFAGVGGLAFLILYYLMVSPMRRLTQSMIAFSENPEDAASIITPSAARGEIAQAERELAAMQVQIRKALSQQKQLADLGAAMSKVSHDLRNMLASAQLISDRIGAIKDPAVQRLAPKLITSLDRAIHLCERTLRGGRLEEQPPKRITFTLAPLVDDIGAAVGISADAGIRWVNRTSADLDISADPEHMFRILLNLGRNAVQAMESADARGDITVSAQAHGGDVRIRISDAGPGVPEAARSKLFQAFAGSTRPEGSGLGLSIASELARAHGGGIELVSSGTGGAVFQVSLPGAVRNRPAMRAVGDTA